MLYLALGANAGRREENIRRAIAAIHERIGCIEKESALYETVPQGFESEHLFLNAAVSCRTDLTPYEILDVTQEIMSQTGTVGRAFDQAGDIRCHKSCFVAHAHNAEIGRQRGEMIVRDFGTCGADARQNRRLSHAGEANQANVRQQL